MTAKSAKVSVSSPRTRDQISAAIVSSSRRGSVAGTTVRLSSAARRFAAGDRRAIERRLLERRQPGGAAPPHGGSTKPGVDVPAGQARQELRVVTAGARPGIERRSLSAGAAPSPPAASRGRGLSV